MNPAKWKVGLTRWVSPTIKLLNAVTKLVEELRRWSS
jgi:hypothetical protein